MLPAIGGAEPPGQLQTRVDVSLSLVTDDSHLLLRARVLERSQMRRVASSYKFQPQHAVIVLNGEPAQQQQIKLQRLCNGPQTGVVLLHIPQGMRGIHLQGRQLRQGVAEVHAEALLYLPGLCSVRLKRNDPDREAIGGRGFVVY